MSPIKLNLGCGLQCPEDWINIDSSIGVKLSKRPIIKKLIYALAPKSLGLPNIDWPSNTVWMDLTKTFQFENESVDFIYSSHTIEHLTYEEATFVFNECYRVLKPNGIIRIIVPDFGSLVENYLSNKKTAPQVAALKFHEYARYFEIPLPNSIFSTLKFYFKRKNNHSFLYDEEGLKHQLNIAGFSNLVAKNYGESNIPSISTIDKMDRFADAICIEGYKIISKG